MKATDVQFRPLRRQVQAYEESWKQDHDLALVCGGVEELLAAGLAAFQGLQRADRAWRDRVFRGTQEYSADANDALQGCYRAWLAVTDAILGIVPDLEARFGVVEGAAEARAYVAEARRLLEQWQPPRLSLAVGMREMTLTPEAAAELERIIENARKNPPPMPVSRVEVRDASFLR